MNEQLSRFETPLQDIALGDIGRFEKVLDIGAGGEGLAARIGKERVYGVDIRADEIKEARNKGAVSNWILCDARKLCFENETFNLVTLWFSLMYVPYTEDKITVLSECRRVLTRDGVLHLIDARISAQKDIFILNARFRLPDGQSVETSYGTIGSQKQSSCWLKKELMKLGFKISRENVEEYWFDFACKK